MALPAELSAALTGALPDVLSIAGLTLLIIVVLSVFRFQRATFTGKKDWTQDEWRGYEKAMEELRQPEANRYDPNADDADSDGYTDKDFDAQYEQMKDEWWEANNMTKN